MLQIFVFIFYVAELSRNLKNVYDNIKVVDDAVKEFIFMIETQLDNNWSLTRVSFFEDILNVSIYDLSSSNILAIEVIIQLKYP